MRALVPLLLLLPIDAHAGLLQYIRVGGGAGCDTASVQAALDLARTTPGPAEIRVALTRTYTAQALVIEDSDYVAIKGGYEDCQSSTPAAYTPLDGFGNGGQPVLRVTISSNADIWLERLQFAGGNVGTGSGGGIRMQGRKTLTLHDTRVRSNLAQHGAGLYVERTQPEQIAQQVLLSGNTLVFANNARFGGAIYSLGGLIDLHDQAQLLENNASEHGGAIYLDRQSRLVAEAGILRDNYAGLDGGGLYVTGGSRVALAATPGQAIEFDNEAGRNGGAIFARAEQANQVTQLDLSGNVSLYGEAAGSGAAIYLEEAGPEAMPARVQLNWNEPTPAIRGVGTLFGFGNHTPQGALVHLKATHGTAQAVLRYLTLPFSRAAELFRLEGRNAQGGAQLFVSDSEIFANHLVSLIRGENADFADFTRVSVGGNPLSGALFAGELRYLHLNSSALYEPGTPMFQALGATQVFAEYLMVHDTSGLPARVDIVQGNPGFVAADHPSSPDLHLSPDSPALDFAPGPGTAGLTDLDGNPRVLDMSTASNVFGPMDLGAFEQFEPSLFRDGFESP